MSFAMSNRDDARDDDGSRLQRALDALAADLDAIERRPHFFASELRDIKWDRRLCRPLCLRGRTIKIRLEVIDRLSSLIAVPDWDTERPVGRAA
jgi:hypothetical protein